ncbi:MAG: type II toxin-antitoxin system VapC family toxin [Puniceicoccaceae bacterium]|nr:MAG: type II toxin-antitoxin system VapC family toxin [Puniceicoccaceae bacterium]
MGGLRYLLDTSVYSQRLRRKPHPGVVQRWSEAGDASFAISIICEAEVLYGLEKKGTDRLWAEYRGFLQNKLVVLPLDRKVIEIYAKTKAEMQSNGHTVGEFDLLIAVTALANQLTLATLNVRDFSKVPDLQVEDWS